MYQGCGTVVCLDRTGNSSTSLFLIQCMCSIWLFINYVIYHISLTVHVCYMFMSFPVKLPVIKRVAGALIL